jgi:hypothetical protein
MTAHSPSGAPAYPAGGMELLRGAALFSATMTIGTRRRAPYEALTCWYAGGWQGSGESSSTAHA